MIFKANIVADTQQNINLCANALRNNQLVAFATETVYGLGANATSSNAVNLVYATKKRPTSNPLIVHFADINTIEEHCYINSTFVKLALAFMPGPLSVLLNKKPTSNISNLCGKNNKIAVRLPNHNTAIQLIKTANVPIAAPSANMANTLSPTTAMHVKQSLQQNLQQNLIILNSNEAPLGLESTVVEIIENNINILRYGYITPEDLQNHNFNVINKSNRINYAPGMLKKHYSPTTKLILNCKASNLTPNHALLNFGSVISNVPSNVVSLNLSVSANLPEAAKNFFSMLWQLDALKKDAICVASIPNIGLGITINDKLQKASCV